MNASVSKKKRGEADSVGPPQSSGASPPRRGQRQLVSHGDWGGSIVMIADHKGMKVADVLDIIFEIARPWIEAEYAKVPKTVAAPPPAVKK